METTHYLTFPFLSKCLVINYNMRGRYTVETKTTTSFLFTPGGRVQFPNSFTESYISRAAEVRYPCKNSDKKNVLLNSRRQYADFLCLYKILLYKIFQHQFCCFGFFLNIHKVKKPTWWGFHGFYGKLIRGVIEGGICWFCPSFVPVNPKCPNALFPTSEIGMPKW